MSQQKNQSQLEDLNIPIKVPVEYILALKERISVIRAGKGLDPTSQYPGYNFKDSNYCVEVIAGAIHASHNITTTNLPVWREAMGLTFSGIEANSGKHDSLISRVLDQLAILDFNNQNSGQFH